MYYLILAIAAVMVAAIICTLLIGRKQQKPAPVVADLDLFGKKRPVRTIKLPDGTVLRLTTPCKAVSDRFEAIGALLDRIATGQAWAGDIAELYTLLAAVLARNLDNITVPEEHLETIMTADDCVEFFAAYMDFLTKEISAKN